MAAGFALGCLAVQPALAWGDMYMGPNQETTDQVYLPAYPTEVNYCPTGLQPVVFNGIICCGVPNAPADPAYRVGH